MKCFLQHIGKKEIVRMNFGNEKNEGKGTKAAHCMPVLALTGLFVIVIACQLPRGCVYGSTVDWLSQHVALAETIRNACMNQKTLLPSFLWLGGGSSGFDFAYYGYLRPDILIGCLFPDIPMAWILITYMLCGYLASVLLCFVWLHMETGSDGLSFFGSVLFLCAGCFFHTHRQVMFINYMPFLLAALISIRKKWYCRTVLFLVLVYCNSFYYAIAVLVAVGWYWYRTRGRKFLKHFIACAAVSIGMTTVLLLPTFLAILRNRRETAAADKVPLFVPKMNFLLYSPYGMGLTVLCLYLLLSGVAKKELRTDSLFFLALSSSGIFAWILNGTLYARGKILIPFVPLLLLHCIRVLSALHRKEMKWRLFPLALLLGCLYCNRNGSRFELMAADTGIVVCFVAAAQIAARRKCSVSRCAYAVLLLMPFLCCIKTAQTESFVTAAQLKEAEEERSFWENAAEWTGKTDTAEAALYRYDSLWDSLDLANRDAPAAGRSSMYSSVTNQKYADFFYHAMQTPISINNRMALLAAENPILLSFLGVRYLETDAAAVPEGYRVLYEEKGRVLAENPDVLPVAYAVRGEDVMTGEAFTKLDAYEKLAALMEKTVVENGTDNETILENILAPKEGGNTEQKTVTQEKGKNTAQEELASEIEKHSVGEETVLQQKSAYPVREISPQFATVTVEGNLSIEPLADGAYRLTARDSADGTAAGLTAELAAPIVQELLLLDFKAENQTKKAVVIDVNGIRNKLSGSGAPYPNENETFHYQLSGGADGSLARLTVTFESGSYILRDLRWHTFPKALLTEKRYTGVTPVAVKGNGIFACTITCEEDGYFVTSLPVQRGMGIRVDGKEAEVLTVNTAFAGTKLSAGAHMVEVTYTPPGLRTGYAVSALFALIFAAWTIRKVHAKIYK